MNEIGILNERTLHAALKRYYEPDTSCHEVRYKGYVADVLNAQGVIEIQTGSFARLKPKLAAFLADTDVTVVYPLVVNKWVSWIDAETGEVTSRRKSPKKAVPAAAPSALFPIGEWLNHERLCVHVIEVDVEEYRRLDGWSHDKKKGATKVERIPTAIGAKTVLHDAADCRRLLPDDLPDSFTSAEFGRLIRLGGRSLWEAQTLLLRLDILRREKVGRSYRYRLSGS